MDRLAKMSVRLLLGLAIVLCIYALAASAPAGDTVSQAVGYNVLSIDSSAVSQGLESNAVSAIDVSVVALETGYLMILLKLSIALSLAALLMLALPGHSKEHAAID